MMFLSLQYSDYKRRDGIYLMATTREKLEKDLKEALRDSGRSGNIVVATTEGLTIASTFREDEKAYTDAISAYATQIVNQVKMILNELGISSPEYIRVKAKDGSEIDIYVKEKKIVIYIQ